MPAYATAEEVQAYLSERGTLVALDVASALAMRATDYLDVMYEYVGEPTTLQAWPRILEEGETAVTPSTVKLATLLVALALAGDAALEPGKARQQVLRERVATGEVDVHYGSTSHNVTSGVLYAPVTRLLARAKLLANYTGNFICIERG